MQFSVTKHIIQHKQSPFRGVINTLIIIIAIPVIIIAAISIALYLLFSWIKDKIVTKRIPAADDNPYHLEIDFFQNEHLKIILIENENDTELMLLNDLWREQVYDEDTYLYRMKTIPQVPSLEGFICCLFFKEHGNSLLLQLVPEQTPHSEALTSQLMSLDLANFQLTNVAEAGAFFLYNDTKDNRLIKGFNKKESITLEVVAVANAAI